MTQPWPVSSLLTSGQAYQKYLTTATVNASFFVGFITNEFRILERLTLILQYNGNVCYVCCNGNVLQFNVDISLSLSPTTLWDNIWWQHCKMQSGVHQLFKSSHKPQQMFVLFVISTSTLPSWPSSQVLKLILSQHQSRRPRGLLSCVMCMLCGPAVSKLDLNSMCENDLPIYCHWEKSRYI